MRRAAMTGLFMLAGSAGGALAVSAHYFLACVMGALAGLTASLIVHAYPRERDYPSQNFWND